MQTKEQYYQEHRPFNAPVRVCVISKHLTLNFYELMQMWLDITAQKYDVKIPFYDYTYENKKIYNRVLLMWWTVRGSTWSVYPDVTVF